MSVFGNPRPPYHARGLRQCLDEIGNRRTL